MEVKILDSILHGQLKPWKMAPSNNKRLAELIKVAKAAVPKTIAELHSALITLLEHQSTLPQVITSHITKNSTVLHPLCYKANLPTYKDTISQFYYLLINYETIRVYNIVLVNSNDWEEPVDIMYQVGKTLNNIKVLAIQTGDELKERNLVTIPDEHSDFVHFTLYYLKHSLIALYFSLQEMFNENINLPISVEDFYLLELQEPLSNVQPLEVVIPLPATEDANQKTKERISFGFLGDKQKLKTIIIDLCREIQLLNEDNTSVDQLLSVLTAKNITSETSKIYLGCETTQFRYIIDGIGLQFSNLKLSTIEKTGIFFSKNGTPLTSQNLSSVKVDNPKKRKL